MAKEYYGLVDEHIDVNERAHPLDSIESDCEKENIISCNVPDYRLSCLGLSLEYNLYHAESGIRVVQAFAT